MKFIIEHKNTKREVEGAFNICISKKDLALLVEQLERKLNVYEEFTFGWIKIYPEIQESIVNTPPKGWDE